MPTHSMSMGVARRNAARVPRRDFAVLQGEDLRFKVTLTSEDSAAGENVSASMRIAIWPGHLQINCQCGWGGLPRLSGLRLYPGSVAPDGGARLRLSGRATRGLCGRYGIAVLSRNSALSVGVLEVMEGPADMPEPGLFTLGQSALDGPDVLPAKIWQGQPVDQEGFAYVA